MTATDLAVDDVIEALDGFYCHNIVVSLWADAVANRLEGMAIYLLSDELPEVAGHARAAARRLADRIGDLGGAVTADPRQLIDRAPGDNEFTIPDCSDPKAITRYALQRLNVIIAAYQAFLDKVRGRDDVSFALVVGLLGAETHRRADVTAALAGNKPQHDDRTAMAMAGDDGCADRRASLTPRPAAERPGPGAGRGDRAASPRTRAHPPGAEHHDHRRAGPDHVLRERGTAV
jgi:ferritin-like protein